MTPERLARSGSTSLFGSGFAALAALGLTVLIGNGLGAYGTGLFFQAVGLFTIASQVLRLGTNSGLVKLISEQRAFGRRGELWRAVVVGVVPVVVVSVVAVAAIMVFSYQLAGWLARSNRDDLAELLRQMAPFIVMGALLAVLQTAARMVRGVWVFTLLQSILLPTSRLIAVAIAIMVSSSAIQAFAAYVAVIPVWLIITTAVIAKPLVDDWRHRRSAHESFTPAFTRFWSFSSSRAIGGAFESALEWSDVLIVAALASPTEAGIYAVATRTVRVGQVVDRAMRLAVSPTISEMLSRSELNAARTLHTSVTRAMILANWPYYLILATMGPALLSVFGEEFRDGAVVLLILAGAMMISAAAGMLQSLLLQGGKSSWQMYNKGISLAISIVLNLILVPTIGILGAAITWSSVVLFDTALAGWQVHRRMGVRLEPRKLLLSMTLPLVVFGGGGLIVRLAFGSTLVGLLVGVLVMGIVYMCLLWALRFRLGIVSIWMEVPLLRRYAKRSSYPEGSATTPKPYDRAH